MHFGGLEDDRKDSTALILLLGPNWVPTDNAV